MNVNVTNILKKVKDFLKPQVALLIAAALLFISIFMPIMDLPRRYEKAVEQQIETAEDYDRDSEVKELKTMLKPSTARLFSTYVLGLLGGDVSASETIMFIAPLTALPLILIIATVALAILKKHLPVVILSAINFIVLLIQKTVFSQVFIDNGEFRWAFGNGFMFFAVILVAAVAVWNVIENKKAKKACADVLK